MSIAKKMMMAGAGTADTGGWDLANAAYNGSPVNWFSVDLIGTTVDTGVNAVFFKTDGTKMYTSGLTLDNVYEYDLSTAWDVSTASYLQSLYVGTISPGSYGIFFKPDGTSLYIVDGSTNRDVHQYDLSTAWNITTASYVRSFYVGGLESNPKDVFFSPDGTNMYVVGTSGDDVNQYSLSTAWNISTASFVRVFSVSAQDTSPWSIFFKSDGTKMYILGTTGDDVNEYNLSTAWDISTASYVQNFSVASFDGLPMSLFFKSDGTEMYVLGSNIGLVFQFDLSTAWDISTASYTYPTTEYLYVGAEDTTPMDIFISPDGTNMYILGDAANEINQYTLSTAWDVTTASYLRTFSVSGQELSPYGLFFSPDGTNMYVTGSGGDDVNQYGLSTAWNISTASYIRTKYIGSQELTPTSLYFRSDGTKMYVLGSSGDEVNEYTLSTAWNVFTATPVALFSVAAQDTLPQGLFFKPDGTKMFIVGSTSDSAHEYSLSTAWDITTASYVQSFGLLGQGLGSPYGITFKTDGTKMYVVDGTQDAVFSYDVVLTP